MEFKKPPFKERKIASLNPDKDVNVSVIGRVIDVKENIIVIDDGTGAVRVVLMESAKDLKTENIIRVFGQLISVQGEMKIRAQFYQKLDGLDLNLYKKYLELSDEDV